MIRNRKQREQFEVVLKNKVTKDSERTGPNVHMLHGKEDKRAASHVQVYSIYSLLTPNVQRERYICHMSQGCDGTHTGSYHCKLPDKENHRIYTHP